MQAHCQRRQGCIVGEADKDALSEAVKDLGSHGCVVCSVFLIATQDRDLWGWHVVRGLVIPLVMVIFMFYSFK